MQLLVLSSGQPQYSSIGWQTEEDLKWEHAAKALRQVPTLTFENATFAQVVVGRRVVPSGWRPSSSEGRDPIAPINSRFPDPDSNSTVNYSMSMSGILFAGLPTTGRGKRNLFFLHFGFETCCPSRLYPTMISYMVIKILTFKNCYHKKIAIKNWNKLIRLTHIIMNSINGQKHNEKKISFDLFYEHKNVCKISLSVKLRDDYILVFCSKGILR